jgi:hypothetical protein
MLLMSNTQRWIALVSALLLAAVVGFWAYQAGVAHGIEQSGKIVVAPAGGSSPYPYPYPPPYPYYRWHPWGFGFFFVPLFFVFWIAVLRSLFWRRRVWYGGGCGARGAFDEWHRQAHARDAGVPPPPSYTER